MGKNYYLTTNQWTLLNRFNTFDMKSGSSFYTGVSMSNQDEAFTSGCKGQPSDNTRARFSLYWDEASTSMRIVRGKGFCDGTLQQGRLGKGIFFYRHDSFLFSPFPHSDLYPFILSYSFPPQCLQHHILANSALHQHDTTSGFKISTRAEISVRDTVSVPYCAMYGFDTFSIFLL